MKIFITWSGSLSNKLAMVLREWLPSVIQAIEPYVSSEDIDKGARWSTDIAKELEAARYGILCVTPENVDAPWLNFEAGALSKTIDKSRVCPFLFGLKRSEIRTGPLLQFQSTIYDQEDIRKLLHSVNNAEEPRLIDEVRLDSVFDVWWPKLKEPLEPLLVEVTAAAPVTEKSKAAEPSDGHSDILEELLELSRNQQKVLNSPEMLLPPSYLEQALRRIGFPSEISPGAVEDLARSYRRLREIVEALREKGDSSVGPILVELLSEMEKPMDYILMRTGRRHRRLIEER